VIFVPFVASVVFVPLWLPSWCDRRRLTVVV
jgi:hypothetical protein